MTKCLPCTIAEEMHLPDDTIVNQNVLNIYLAKRYDLENGVDPIYLKIAEGVSLIDRKRNKEQLCSKVKFLTQKNGNDIESYVSMILSDSKYKSRYDAFVFIKIHSQSDFMVFGISWSDRIIEKLKNEDTRFIKNYAISIVLHHYFKDKK